VRILNFDDAVSYFLLENGAGRNIPSASLSTVIIMHTQTALKNSIDVHNLLTEGLDQTMLAAERGKAIARIVPEIVEHARHVLSHVTDQSELDALRASAKCHPITEYLNQCPLTVHSAQQPRGYPGDAELIDYLYHHTDRTADIARATAIGRQILQTNLDRPAPIAVRARRQIVADLISHIAAKTPSARILSVACGHARELELVDHALLERIATFLAFDQDAKSLEVATRYRTKPGIPRIAPQCGTIMDLLKDTQLDDFELVYSSGLYDYLSDRLCQRLTQNLFERLKPGGTLLLANFLPETPDIGYMEIFMNWSLRYRSKQQIHDFAATINENLISDIEYFTDSHQNIGFLKIVKGVMY